MPPSPAPARIAVIIPARDAAGVIGRALESLARQTRPADEIVVVDDGSGDGTAHVVRRWVDDGALPLRLLRQESRGASSARNAGLEACRSDLVLSLDADDELLPHGLGLLEAGFRFWPDLVLCFGDAERQASEGPGPTYLDGKRIHDLPVESASRTNGHELRRLGGGVFESLLGGSYIANGAALFTRRAALDIGGWDVAFPTAEDRDFWLRMSRRGSCAWTPSPVARIWYHGDNLMRRTRGAAHARNAVAVLDKTLRNADRLGLDAGQRSDVQGALRRAADTALRTGSEAGARELGRAVSTAWRAGWRPRPRDARHALRLVRRMLRAGFGPGGPDGADGTDAGHQGHQAETANAAAPATAARPRK